MRKLKGLWAPLRLVLPTSEYTEATLWDSARPIPAALPFLAAHPFASAPLQSARALFWQAISNITYPSASCDFAPVSVFKGTNVCGATPYGENAVAGGFEWANGLDGPLHILKSLSVRPNKHLLGSCD